MQCKSSLFLYNKSMHAACNKILSPKGAQKAVLHMNKNQDRATAYEKIVELCCQHGIIPSPSMTESELLIVLDKLLQDIGVPREKV